MDTPITRAEHEEFRRRIETECKRLADEDNRQNRRLETMESNVKEFSVLAASVEKLATNMDSMLKELERQGKRLEILERRDGEMWRKFIGYAVSTALGLVLGYLFRQIGLN